MEKKFGENKILVGKKSCLEKNVGEKKCLVGKKSWLEKNVGRKKFWLDFFKTYIIGWTTFLVVKFLVRKNFGRKNLWPEKILFKKHFCSEKNVGWRIFLVGQNF